MEKSIFSMSLSEIRALSYADISELSVYDVAEIVDEWAAMVDRIKKVQEVIENRRKRIGLTDCNQRFYLYSLGRMLETGYNGFDNQPTSIQIDEAIIYAWDGYVDIQTMPGVSIESILVRFHWYHHAGTEYRNVHDDAGHLFNIDKDRYRFEFESESLY